MAQAAVLRTYGEPLVVTELHLADPAPDQARVRIVASGVCHSDLSMADGALPFPVPAVLGHEGAGVVEQVGSAVTHVRPGDHVVLNWTPACRQCWFCAHGEPHLCERALVDTFSMPYGTDAAGDALVPVMGTGTFATETLALGRALVPVHPDVPLDVAALVGCAVTTGFGSAVYTAGVRPGESVVVIGCGGVGLSAVLGSVYAGAERVIAVDPVAPRRELAARLGATDVLDPAAGDVAAAVGGLTGGRGADRVLEVVGRSETIQVAWQCARRGGTVAVVGAGRYDDPVSFPAFDLFFAAKTLVGSQYGSCDPDRDFPLILGLWQDGTLDLDSLIGARVPLEGVNQALADLRSGTGLRTVIVND